MIEVTDKTPFCFPFSVSGLVTALTAAVPSQGSLWIGGICDKDFDQYTRCLEESKRQLKPVSIPEEVHKLHKKWCNVKLWPFLHEMLNEADDTVESLKCWKGYEAVNQRYAEAIKRLLSSSKRETRSIVWIHDYHLLLVPKLVKQFAGKHKTICPIGFFLHTPFPTLETFEQLPNFIPMLEGILGSDSIGFHTERYCENFLACCKKYFDCRVKKVKSKFELHYHGRKVLVQATPAGIMYETFSQHSIGRLSKELPLDLKKLELTTDRIILIGVDRLDYTKGLLQKIKAFLILQDLIHKNPYNLQDVLYLQIAIPCRDDEQTYINLKKEYEKKVLEAKQYLEDNNCKSQIEVTYDKVSPQDLCVLYAKADVALVTPLKDGLNLVALEYIVCQTGNPGVLILSKNTGIAQYLPDALLVDPYNVEEVARAIYHAITMPTTERQNIMDKLQTQAKELSAKKWCKSSLEPLRDLTYNHKASL